MGLSWPGPPFCTKCGIFTTRSRAPIFFAKFLLDCNATSYFYGLKVGASEGRYVADGASVDVREMVQRQHAWLDESFPDYQRPARIGVDLQVDIYLMLETLGLLTELLAARAAGGDDLMNSHFSALRGQREPASFRLYDAVFSGGSADSAELDRLGHVLTIFITTSRRPAAELAALAEQHSAPGDPAILRDLLGSFDRGALAQLEECHPPPPRMRLMKGDGTPLDNGAVQWETLIDARNAVLDCHAEGNATISNYVQRLDQLPLPPTCFYADEKMIERRAFPYTSKRRLTDVYGEALTLYHLRNIDYKACVTAALIPTLGMRSPFALSRVHLTLFFRYLFQQHLGRPQSFTPHVDAAFHEFIESEMA